MATKMVVEIVAGVGGLALVIDGTRVAGPKPWGGGTIERRWEVDVARLPAVTKRRLRAKPRKG